jgi:hypothetical protein
VPDPRAQLRPRARALGSRRCRCFPDRDGLIVLGLAYIGRAQLRGPGYVVFKPVSSPWWCVVGGFSPGLPGCGSVLWWVCVVFWGVWGSGCVRGLGGGAGGVFSSVGLGAWRVVGSRSRVGVVSGPGGRGLVWGCAVQGSGGGGCRGWCSRAGVRLSGSPGVHGVLAREGTVPCATGSLLRVGSSACRVVVPGVGGTAVTLCRPGACPRGLGGCAGGAVGGGGVSGHDTRWAVVPGCRRVFERSDGSYMASRGFK